MKKFKVKNRQKRKYVRRTQESSPSSLIRPTITGVVPLLIVAVVFLTTVIITTRPIDPSFNPQISISMPSFPYEAFSQLSKQIKPITITLPEIHFSPQPITPPQVDTSAVSQSLSQLETTMLLQLSKGRNHILNFLSTINPVPLFIFTAQEIITTEIRFLQATFNRTTHVFTFILTADIFMMKQLVIVTQEFVSDTVHALHIVSQTALFVGKITITFLSSVIKNISMAIQVFSTKVITLFNAIGNLIQTPFRAMGDYYQQMKPGLDFIGVHITKSFSNISAGMNNLTTLPSEIIEPPKQ